MSTIHFNQTTTLTPEQYIAGLTDFGPGRSKVFSESADDYLKVHLVLGTVGKGVLAKAFASSIKAIEARNDGATAMSSAAVRAES
jgi:hypothetical protein